jgi:hypothetical protein
MMLGQHMPGQVHLQVMFMIKVMPQFGVSITECKLVMLANCDTGMKHINLNHGLVQCVVTPNTEILQFCMTADYKTSPPFSVASIQLHNIDILSLHQHIVIA